MTGMEVTHKAFGKGQIISQINGIQVIVFAAGEKKFQFPTAYTGGYLKADEEIMAALKEADQRKKELVTAQNEVASLTERINQLRKVL